MGMESDLKVMSQMPKIGGGSGVAVSGFEPRMTMLCLPLVSDQSVVQKERSSSKVARVEFVRLSSAFVRRLFVVVSSYVRVDAIVGLWWC